MAVKLIILALCIAISHAGNIGRSIPELGGTHANGCPIDYYVTYLTPHPDCSLYYSCVYGKKVEQSCQAGLLFSYKQQACVWPWESDCNEGGNGESGNPGNPEVPVQPEPDSAVPELGETHSNGCPIDYYITYLTSHADCSLYYSCVYGKKVVQNCQDGLLFSYKRQACVWPWETDCKQDISPPDVLEPANPGNVDTPVQPKPEPVVPQFEEKYANGCPINYYITYLMPHPDCSRYYSCVNGKKVEQVCPSTLLFNFEQQACAWSWESDCQASSGGGSSAGSGSQSGNPGSGSGGESNPGSAVQPPPSGFPDVTETHANGCPTDYHITYLLPHNNCNLYYSCSYGNKVEQSCQPGLLFSYIQQACVWPWESDCVEGGAGPEPGNPDIPVQPEPESAIPELGETYANGCPIDYYITYLMPHPICSLYYTCLYGKKVEQNCQSGLLFNYRLQSCVWPEESDCTGRSQK